MNLFTVLLTASMMLVTPIIAESETCIVTYNAEESKYTTFVEYMHKDTEEIQSVQDCIEYINMTFLYYCMGSYDEDLGRLFEEYDFAIGLANDCDIAYALEVTNNFIKELANDDIEFSPYRDPIDEGLLLELEGAVQMMLDSACIDERLLRNSAVLHILYQE